MSREEMADATVQIAQEYATSQNLDVAREQLADLDVANVNQWLLFVTETHIANGGDAAGEQALTDLGNALGLNSNTSVAATGEESTGEEVAGVEAPAPADDAVTDAVTDAGETADESAEAQPVVIVSDLASSSDESSTNEEAAPAADASEGNAASSSEMPVIEIEPVVSPDTAADTGEAAAEDTGPQAATLTASNGMNVRGGPGLEYNIVGAMQTGETAQITGKNPAGDWWEITMATGQQGWVYSPLVTTAGDTGSVALATNIPTPPPIVPTVAPEPVAEEVAPPAEEAPAEEAPAEEPPAEEAAPQPAGTHFTLIERRLWGPQENGGRMDGDSVVCGEKRQLQVHVLDAGGAPLNGIAVQVLYGNKEIEVTGAQGKGDGMSEFILGDGQDVTVVKDTDGSQASSDVASNLTTKPYAIDFNDLIQAGYCTDAASCQKNVVDVYACGGHYSWTVKFQRNY